MTLAAGHSVILTDRFHRHAATPASVPPNRSPAAEDMVSADHLAAAVAVMAEASAVALTDSSGWPRRLSSPPSTEEQEGAIYCAGDGGVTSGTKHLLSSKFFSSSVVEKQKACGPPENSHSLQLAESGHPLSVLSPAAAEAAFAFGVALAREEFYSQSSSARTILNQTVSSNSSSRQRSSKPSGSQSTAPATVHGSDKGAWRKGPSNQRHAPTGDIGWIQSATSSEAGQL